MPNSQHKPWKSDNRQQCPDDLYMPAMPPLWLITWLEKWWVRRQRRCRIRRLLRMNRHLLTDLGHSRAGLKEALRRGRSISSS